MLFFRSEEHASAWCARWGQPHGVVLTPAQVWGLARAYYAADRRAPDWRRNTLEESEAIFAALGLVGPFWALR
jgi:hypothetical protein